MEVLLNDPELQSSFSFSSHSLLFPSLHLIPSNQQELSEGTAELMKVVVGVERSTRQLPKRVVLEELTELAYADMRIAYR